MSKSAVHPPSSGLRGRGVNPKPPEPGTLARVLLRALRADPFTAWPPARLLEQAALSPAGGYPALTRLLELGLVEKHSSDDAVVRVILTAHGRRFRL